MDLQEEDETKILRGQLVYLGFCSHWEEDREMQ